jgi:hypothetical protein
MATKLGNYFVEWGYDPNKHSTRCSIKDIYGTTIVKTYAVMSYKSNYDKVRARTVTFKKAVKEMTEKKLLTLEDINVLINKFSQLPNKGVI